MNSDVFLTDYVGDVVNLILNKPSNYRITYIPNNIYPGSGTDGDIYLIADSDDYIHGEMLEVAIENGWLPNLVSNMRKYHENTMYVDSNRTVNLLFVPKNNFSEIEYSFDREYPIESGSLMSKIKDGKLETKAPELYDALKKYAVDICEYTDDNEWGEM